MIKDSSTEEATGLITGAIDRAWVQQNLTKN
jgi:hypothetical protein